MKNGSFLPHTARNGGLTDEAWSRANADRRLAGERDDHDSILEPGFWMTALVAFLPTVAGCLYLFLTQG
ncbi:hypothetical protein IC761_09150 [Bradyrhizobium commune]|uniref:Uncharacterized protein n=2 Tax=Bradyrhizobium commune TaxID=83627 RepID=A0A7S9H3R8_9BRAD|nr:hypothetical protein IC761_09150 [Bradyrhizobium commune]